MSEYVVEKSPFQKDAWHIRNGERFLGPYESLEVANAWALWYALEELKSKLSGREHDPGATDVANELAVLLPDLREAIKKREEWALKIDEVQKPFRQALKENGISIEFAEPNPAPSVDISDTQPELC